MSLSSSAPRAASPAPHPPTVKNTGAQEVFYMRPSKGWSALNLMELWRYRELTYFLVWRDLKVRYKQTLLGAAWALCAATLVLLLGAFVVNLQAENAEPVRGEEQPGFEPLPELEGL